jgi:FkbH-like protein
MAEELNIGMDSMVFVDDNPTERELVRQMLPEVTVPEFPDQPYELPAFFEKMVNDYFKVYSITEEDRKKTLQYQANASRAREQRSYGDFTGFLKSLDLQMIIEQANDFNIPRIAQMTQKTNQFNLTTHRYTDADIRLHLSEGWKIWCLSVADKFGDNGITGCVMVNGSVIDTLLLSCRILGKGIEYAFLKRVIKMLTNQGVRKISASYIPTTKNAQVAEFYDNCGFSLVSEENGTKKYVLIVEEADLKIEDYYHITIK